MNFSIDDNDLHNRIQEGKKIIIQDGEGNLYELKPYVNEN